MVAAEACDRARVPGLRLRPSVHDAVNNLVQVRARVDVVRDARRDDRQDVRGTFAAFVEPCEQPVLATDHQASELALSAVVGGFDVPVFEEKQQPGPLPVQVAEALAKRRLGRNDGLLTVDPSPKLVENRPTELFASLAPLLGVVTRARRVSFDREQVEQ